MAHEHDVRGSVGTPLEEAGTSYVADRLANVFAQRRRTEGLPAVRLVGDGREWTLGEAEPVATLRAGDFEIARMLVGRRSRAQILKLDWDGDPAAVLDQLHLFELPDDDLAY